MTGDLIIIAGPMRCDSATVEGAPGTYGKTGAAIRLIWATKDVWGKAVCSFQPEANVRDGAHLKAKSGEYCSAYQEGDAENLRMIDGYTPNVVYAVVVEEAHLWEDPKALLCAIAGALGRGVHVVLIGVETDHTNEPFDWWPMALDLAAGMVGYGARADVHKLSATCQCGRRATRTFRHGLSNARIQVKDAGLYESVCERCGDICEAARRARWEARPAQPDDVELVPIRLLGGAT